MLRTASSACLVVGVRCGVDHRASPPLLCPSRRFSPQYRAPCPWSPCGRRCGERHARDRGYGGMAPILCHVPRPRLPAACDPCPEGVHRKGVHRIGFFEAVAGIRRNAFMVGWGGTGFRDQRPFATHPCPLLSWDTSLGPRGQDWAHIYLAHTRSPRGLQSLVAILGEDTGCR